MQIKLLGALAAALVVEACASFPAGRGLSETQQLAAERGLAGAPADGPRDCAANEELTRLVAEPLSSDTAVQMALMCNAELAAEYARFGIARAEAFQAGRLANPQVNAAALDSSTHGAPAQIELGLVQNFTNLLLRGSRTRLAEGEFLRAEQLLAADILRLAADTKAGYYALVDAQQVAAVRHAIADATQISYDLAVRSRDAGNLSARALAEYAAERAEAHVAARRADDDIAEAHARLEVRLGLPAAVQWRVPQQLPLPVTAEDDLAALLARARQNRLDLTAATGRVMLLAESEAAARKYRWLGDFEIGVAYERDPDRSRLLGPTLSVQLPIFDQGQGAVARAGALKDWADAERRRLSQAVDADVRLAAQRVVNARGRIDDYRNQLIPQRQIVVARAQEEANYMLTGIFALIAARRAEFEAYQGYLEALRDYWIARADLERAVGAGLPSDASRGTQTIDVHELLSAPPMTHGMHDHGAMQMNTAPEHAAEPKPAQSQPAQHEHDMPMPETDRHDQHGEQP